MDKQKHHYLLSIDKKQIFFISLVFSLTLALFFLIGLNFGGNFSANQGENYISAVENRSEINRLDKRNNSGTGRNFGEKDDNFVKDLEKIGAKDEKNQLGDTEDQSRAGIVFENYLDSEKLLEQENLRLTREKPKKIAGTVETFSQKKPYEGNIAQNASVVKEKSAEQPSPPKKLAAYETKPLPGVDYFFIQIIATADLAKAKRIASELTSKKYLAVVHKSFIDTGSSKKPVFLVRIGLYKDKQIAKSHLKKIISLGGFSDAFISRYREQG